MTRIADLTFTDLRYVLCIMNYRRSYTLWQKSLKPSALSPEPECGFIYAPDPAAE